MNRKIPVILVLTLLTGSLVNAHSPQYSEKLRLGSKKNFSRVQGESRSEKVGYNRGDERLIGAVAPGALDDPYGYITSYGYDGFDRISRVTDPLNNVTLIGRANTGNLLSLKQLDATGQQILLQSIRINDPAGRLKSYTVKMPNPDDDITYTRTYEDNGKRIIFKDPLERQTVVQLNDDGKVDTVTDAAGNMIKYYYEDGRGNATKKEETVKSADGTKTETYFTEYKYNAHNQVETITDLQTQAVTTFTYDLKGNLTGTIDAEGNTITHEYDELGRRIKTLQHFKDTSLKPVETTFEYYPAMGKDPETGNVVYSPSNRLKSITDDKGNKTTYEYDYRNRVKKVTYPDLTFTEYTYDKTATGASNSSGNPTYYRLVVEKQRNDTVVKNYYDQLQRLMKREIIPAEGAAGTTIETFTYDELSRVKHATDDDTALDYQFDRANRLDNETQVGKLIDYTYNKVSNLTDLKYPNTKLIEMQYDQLNRMNLIKEGTFTIADMTHIGRSYRLLRKQYGNGDLITYLYDQGRRLQDLEAKNLNNNSLINHYRYGYNKINLKTFEQRLHNAGKADVLGYDALYRLTNVKFNANDPLNPTEFEREKSIDHDNLHNTISIIESFNGQTRSIIPEIPEGSDYSKLNQHARFDQWGLEYDKNGNLKQKGTQRLTHDYRNQLVSAVDGTLSVEMKYDVMGRRVQKAVTKCSQTEVRNYYYAGHQLIEERDGNDQVTRQYIYGNGIDEIIRMDKYEGTIVTSYYFHTDSIGSITAITDSQGNLVERVTYDTYGMPTFWDPAGNKIPESLIGNTILFQGREYDPELNLYYYRARYYDPIMGRFLETDPMGYADSMNLYQGFNMNPANFTDPYGELIKAEYGKHDVFSTQEVKTGKWYLDYTVVGMFNEVRNACALGINLGSNLLGGTDDLAFEGGDYALAKVGIIERGELRDDPYMRDMVNAVLLAESGNISRGTKSLVDKVDDLTLKLYQLVKSKGGKVLDVRKNVMVVADADLLNTDDLSKVFAGNGGTLNSLDDIPIMSTDEVKDALTASGNYKKGTDWAFSIHDHHFNPKWLGGPNDGPILRLRGFEHITDMEPELFEYIKKRIPRIRLKETSHVESLIQRGLVTQEKVTEVLFDFYKSRYPKLSDEAIMNALKGGI